MLPSRVLRLLVGISLITGMAGSAAAQPLLPRTAAQVAAPQQPEPLAQAPFQLTVEQENQLDVVLRAWQQNSNAVKTFTCDFTLFEYDAVWGNDDQKPTRVVEGDIKYAQPDKGLYRQKIEGGEYWVCDGKAIFEFNAAKKELIENRLPPQLQGKAIADGPLPFVFGVDAAKLRQRYWMRIVTPEGAKGQIWLEAFPRTRQDAANFRKVDMILSDKDLAPFALQLFEPQGKVRKVYQFSKVTINSPLHKLQEFVNWFVAPRTPPGWRYIVQEAPVAPAAPPQPVAGGAAAGQGPGQAVRPNTPLR